MDKQVDAGKPEKSEATILVVDDEPANLGVLNAVLQPHFRVRVARSGAEALRAVGTAPRPDLVLLDIMMPEMDGYEVLSRLRKSPDFASLPVIFVTAMTATENEQRGLELGAVDYITKPVHPELVLARVRAQLELKSARDRLADQNARLESLVAERTLSLKKVLESVEAANAALKKTYFGTLMAINALAELRAVSIGEHSRRVAGMARQLANALGMSGEDSQDVFVAALLHDIGKIGFPDSLLHKPVNALNTEEFILYRKHPVLAADTLGKIEGLSDVANIVRYHHEHFDGSGFPEMRSGLNIPLGARILAAVSDYDDFRHGAMTAKPLSAKESHRHLVDGRGHHYDPSVIDRMESILSASESIEVDEIKVAAMHLQEGMILTRNVMHPEGFLLLSQNTPLVRRLIDQLVTVERDSGINLEVYVLREHRRGN